MKPDIKCPKQGCWRVCDRFSDSCYLMCTTINGIVHYAPLYIHSFRLVAPRRLLDAQTFNTQYHDYSEIKAFPDRLRWCRHHKGILQKDVAKVLGLTSSNYRNLENGRQEYLEKSIIDKLAAFYGLSPADLLDDYNLFLYRGQGKQLRAYRQQLNMSREQFAEFFHISPVSLASWECDKNRMFKRQWEQHFKQIDFSAVE